MRARERGRGRGGEGIPSGLQDVGGAPPLDHEIMTPAEFKSRGLSGA